ncbi:MAG: O-antigen ligase family protein [Thiomicrospira sp.]|nr:O-antigen ligase family protein [Thiomicrospira sp.]NCO82485.1 O-antigen ligase family protein [Thiomicrospira sp.]
MNVHAIYHFVLNLSLFLFLPLMLVGKDFAKGYEYWIVLIGLPAILYFNLRGKLFSDIEEKYLYFVFFFYFLILLGWFNQMPELTRFPSTLETYSKTVLLPVLLLPMLYLINLKTLSFLAWSAGVGTIVGISIAIYGVVHGFPRSGGELIHGSPIIFGNLAMLFGVLSFVFSAYYYRTKWFGIFILFGIFGIVTSVLSGTRGGWIVFFTLPIFLAFQLPPRYRWRVLGVFSLLIITLFAIFVLSDSVVKTRIIQAYREIGYIFSENGFTGGSIGSRFEFWRVSWLAFLEAPLMGIGVGEFYAFKHDLNQTGGLAKHLVPFNHSHNEYLTILSTMGLVGFLVYSFFYIWLWKIFSRAIRSRADEIKLIGVLGIVTLVCYLDFGLSESFISTDLGGGTFYFLITLLLYYLNKFQLMESNKSIQND